MPTPFLEENVLELSRWIQDERLGIGENDAEHDFSEATLVSAINRAVRILINTIIEKETDEDKLAVALNEYIVEVKNLQVTSNLADMPEEALKGLTVFKVRLDGIPPVSINKYMIYTTPSLWHSVTGESYNPEEAFTQDSDRWTEFGRQIRTMGITEGKINYMYIEKHQYVNLGDTNDLKINDRFQNELLEIAQKLIEKVAPIN